MEKSNKKGKKKEQEIETEKPLATYWISPAGELRRNHLAISSFWL